MLDRVKPHDAVEARGHHYPPCPRGGASVGRGTEGRAVPGWMVWERGAGGLGTFSEVPPLFPQEGLLVLLLQREVLLLIL